MSNINSSKQKLQAGEYHFDEVFQRVCKYLKIATQAELATILQTGRNNIAQAKRKGTFPIKWAIILSAKYGLSLDFILQGEKSGKPALPTPTSKLAKQALDYLAHASAKIMRLDSEYNKALENKR